MVFSLVHDIFNNRNKNSIKENIQHLSLTTAICRSLDCLSPHKHVSGNFLCEQVGSQPFSNFIETSVVIPSAAILFASILI